MTGLVSYRKRKRHQGSLSLVRRQPSMSPPGTESASPVILNFQRDLELPVSGTPRKQCLLLKPPGHGILL